MHHHRKASADVINLEYKLILTQIAQFFLTSLLVALGLEIGAIIGDYVYHDILNKIGPFHGPSNLRVILGALSGGLISGLFIFAYIEVNRTRQTSGLYFGAYFFAILIYFGSTIFLDDDYSTLKFWAYKIGVFAVTSFSLLFVFEKIRKKKNDKLENHSNR